MANSQSSLNDDSKYRDFAHVGPDALAGQYMRTFWHPVYRSEDLKPGTAKPVRLMGEDFTLYRGESKKPYLVGPRCRHRGTQLSTGWVEGEDIRCFYHGWKYDCTGQCIEQPAEPKFFGRDTPIPVYAAADYLGMVFAFIGKGDAPPIPRYENFEGEDRIVVVNLDYRGYNFFQDFENGMDRVHGGFVHRSLPGSFDGRVDSPLVRAEEDDWGLKTIAQHPSGRHGVQSFGMPNKQHIIFTFGDKELLTWKVPVDDENTAHFTVSMYQGSDRIDAYERDREKRHNLSQMDAFKLAQEVIAGRLTHDEVDPDSTNMVWFQDNIALLGQGIIADRDNEYLGASDAPVILLRRLWERELRAFDEGRPLKQWRYQPNAELKKA